MLKQLYSKYTEGVNLCLNGVFLSVNFPFFLTFLSDFSIVDFQAAASIVLTVINIVGSTVAALLTLKKFLSNTDKKNTDE